MAQLNKFAESLKEASALESFWNGWVTARADNLLLLQLFAVCCIFYVGYFIL